MCSYVLSEFIDGVFEKLLSSIIIFYDKNKKYLSGGQYSTFTTPENANYIRISPNKDALKKQLLLEKGIEPSKIWVPYCEALYVKGENDSSVIGLTIPNWVTLKGLGNRENVILKAKFANKMQHVSTLNFKETGAIENLTVTGENTRYVIHDDFARESNGYKRIVKHCIIKGITTYYSTVYGAGTGDGADWEFEDVVFDGSQVGANSRPANTFTVHNVLASQKNRNIVFKNCIFVSTNEKNVKFKTLAYRTSTGADNANNMLTNVSLYGCKFDGTSKGFELVEENPDVYGKGCYYYVNGYGNVNAGYEITTTDNKDYSNRVNLI